VRLSDAIPRDVATPSVGRAGVKRKSPQESEAEAETAERPRSNWSREDLTLDRDAPSGASIQYTDSRTRPFRDVTQFVTQTKDQSVRWWVGGSRLGLIRWLTLIAARDRSFFFLPRLPPFRFALPFSSALRFSLPFSSLRSPQYHLRWSSIPIRQPSAWSLHS